MSPAKIFLRNTESSENVKFTGAELILGLFQSGPTPPSDSQKGAKA